MIEYDYDMIRFTQKETKEFEPRFNNRISNIAIFRGRNSSGKSTFMNLTALALYGIDSPGVALSLKKRLKRLQDDPNSEFRFNISANNSIITLKASVRKEGFIDSIGEYESHITEIRDNIEKELTKEEFLQKYRLIYDIPDNPLERVTELVTEVSNTINDKIASLQSFRAFLQEELRRAEDSKDEDLISFLKNEIEQKTAEKEDLEDRINNEERLLKRLNQYYYSSSLKDLYHKQEKLDKEKRQVTTDIAKKKSNESKINKKYDLVFNLTKTYIKTTITTYNQACELIRKEGNVDINPSKFWDFDDIRDIDIINDRCQQLFEFRNCAKMLIGEIQKIYLNEDCMKKIEKGNLLDRLIAALAPYCDDDIELLESPINSIYTQLSSELEHTRNETAGIESLKEAIDLIERSIRASKDAEDSFKRLGEPPSSDVTCSSSDINEIIESLKKVNKSIDDLITSGAVFGISSDTYGKIYEESFSDPLIKNYISLQGANLKCTIDEFDNSIKSDRRKLDNYERLISKKTYELENAEAKDTHPLSDYTNEMRILNEQMESLLSSLNKKGKILRDLHQNGIVSDNGDGFLEQVWTYLGSRLGTIQHIQDEYEIEKINMNEHNIYTKAGDVINFADMGTGESQFAYLSGLLNSDDNRVTIALFDESDHMDPELISKVQMMMKDQYNEGKLLIGIMAAPGISPEVMNYE